MAKGGNFEIKIARALSIWWSNGTDEDLFWRSRGSGGTATRRARSGKETLQGHEGDISCDKPSGKPLIDYMVFECKKGYQKDTVQDEFDALPAAKLQTFESWVMQAHEAHIQANSATWGLITERGKRVPLLWMPLTAWEHISVANFHFWPQMIFKFKSRQWNYQWELIGMTFECFLKSSSPDHIKQALEDLKNDRPDFSYQLPETQKAIPKAWRNNDLGRSIRQGQI